MNLVNKPIKKRWFRNIYIVEYGQGYAATLHVTNWATARAYQEAGWPVYGPYWTHAGAKADADQENRRSYNILFK